MGKQEKEISGATVERGRIAESTGGGYRVENLDRRGLISCVIGGIDDTAYSVGDTVYFFMFRDGTGKIVCKV